MKYKIIIDSSCDLCENYLEGTDIGFAIVPFRVNVGDSEFIDDGNIDTENLLNALERFKGKPSSACPCPNMFSKNMTGAEKYFLITISSKLSASYNSARIAKNEFEKPEDVFIIDSRLVGGSMVLIVDKLTSFIKSGLEYKDICKEIQNYVENDIGLLFTLNDYSNLVKNGRMTALQAMLASTLKIKPLCCGKNGEIKVVKKIIGEKRAVKEIMTLIEQDKTRLNKGTCVITHAQNLDSAKHLESLFIKSKTFEKVRILTMKGLCSFYAMRKGIIVSYEK